MKRYRTESTFQKLVDKYKLVYLFTYTLGFLLLSIIVGIVLYVTLSSTFLNSAKKDIVSYAQSYRIINVEGPNVNQGEGQDNDQGQFNIGTINPPSLIDPSMSAVVYYTDESGGVIEYKIIGADFSEDYYNAIKEDFDIERTEDKFIVTVINDNYYLTNLYKIDNPGYQKVNLTGYVRIYNNIDGEFKLRSQVFSIFVMIAIVAFGVSFGLGFLVMKEGTRPLALFVQKQTNFVSDASHELRTPLAVVQSKIETVLSQPDKTVCEVSEDLAIALSEISRLTKLTQELLTLARNDKDNIEINPVILDLDKELKEITEPFVEIASISGKTLKYEGTSALVKVDKDKFKQIMIINIDNALKYTEEGDSITISLKQLKDEVQIQIADTGIGLSDEAKSKVFDRFYRADKARSRETGGNGLGLSIAYTLVHLQKGNILVYDNQPKGTRFVISFPRAKDRDTLQIEDKQ